MKKKWIVLVGCIIINLCSVGYLQKHENTESNVSVMYINEVPFRCYQEQYGRFYVKAKDLEKLGFETTYDESSNKWYIERPNGEIATEQYKDEVITPIPNVSYTIEGNREDAPRVFVEGVELYYSEYLDGDLVINPVQLEKYYLYEYNFYYPKSSLRIDKDNYTAYLTFQNEHAMVEVSETGKKVRTTIPLEDYVGAVPETDFRLYHGFYSKYNTYPILKIFANGEKANYYFLESEFYAEGISSLGYRYRIEDDKLIILPTWRTNKIVGADRSRYFKIYDDAVIRDCYVFASGYRTQDSSRTVWTELTCVELNDVYYGGKILEQKEKFPAVISCGGNLMINEEILQQFIDIPVYETAEEKSEAEKQKKQEEKKVNAIFLGLCAVVIIFYQLKKQKLF